jgi:ribosomal protein S18 acetylase RimI-like enzyme
LTSSHSIRRLSAKEIDQSAPSLAALLTDAVRDGASIGFMDDLTLERATDYWRSVAASPEGRVVLVGEDTDGVVGVVIVAPIDNEIQPHRAEICKLAVHRRARGRGLGTALMLAAEAQASAMGKTLATLFTRDRSGAERLYSRLGWVKVGVIPEDSVKPDGTLCDAAIFYKRIGQSGPEVG